MSQRAGSAFAVLAYHKLGEPAPGGWPTWFYVSVERFRDQLAELDRQGFEVVDIERLLAGLEGAVALPERTALISFDDGYRSLLELGAPILREREWPAVLFMPSDHVGADNSFDDEPRELLCGWDELRELARARVSVQSHGASHRSFGRLPEADLCTELVRSKAVLEQGLGQSVEALAYPYGDPGADPQETANALAEAGYRAAFLYTGGPIRQPIQRYGLTRIPIGADTDLRALLSLET